MLNKLGRKIQRSLVRSFGKKDETFQQKEPELTNQLTKLTLLEGIKHFSGYCCLFAVGKKESKQKKKQSSNLVAFFHVSLQSEFDVVHVDATNSRLEAHGVSENKRAAALIVFVDFVCFVLKIYII